MHDHEGHDGGTIKHSQRTQSNKFTMSLQYL